MAAQSTGRNNPDADEVIEIWRYFEKQVGKEAANSLTVAYYLNGLTEVQQTIADLKLAE